jgi:predicted exporter
MKGASPRRAIGPRSVALRWIAWLAFVIACVLALGRATIVTDITAFLPGPATAEQRLLAEQLRDGVAARIVLIGIEAQGGEADGGEAQGAQHSAAAARAARALAQKLRTDQRFTFVADGDPRSFEREQRLLFDARYLLSPQFGAESFTEAGLRAAFARLEAQLGSALAPAIRPLAPADPTGEMLAVLARLAQQPPPASQHGAWFAADGRTALVLAQTRAPGFDIDAQQDAVSALHAAFEQVRGADAGLSLQLAGPGVFAVESRALIERDARRLSLLATVLIGALLLIALRSPRFLLLAAVPVASGAAGGLAAVTLGFGAIHGITLGFGLTLVGEAVDYAIYVYVQRAGDEAKLWRALWLAVATSAAGFIAMIASGFQGLAQLGVFSLVGIAVAGVVARWLLPSLLPAPGAVRLVPARWPPRATSVLRALQVVVLVAAVAAAGLLAARRDRLWNDELAAISPLAAAAGELDAKLRGAAGLPELRWVIALERPAQEDVLQAAEALRPALEQLRVRKALAAFDSPADLVPSMHEQARRLAALPSADVLRARLAAALAGGNFEPAAFEPFIAAVDAARAMAAITPAYYQGSAFAQRLAAQLIERPGGGAAVLVTLHGVDPAAAAQIRAALAPHRASLIDMKGDVEALIADYRQRAVWAAAGGCVLIVFLLAFWLRAPGAVVRIVIALGTAVLITAGALVALAGALTLFHWVALLLVAGLGSNYALFFARLPADTTARRATLASVLLAATTTLVAFVLLATSSTPVLHMIGATVAIGVVAALAASAALSRIE